MIDIHAHLSLTGRLPHDRRPRLTVEQWLDRMKREGIDQAVLLPLESPETNTSYFLTEEAIAAAQRYPERFFAFVHIDTRMSRSTDLIAPFAKTHQVKGYMSDIAGITFLRMYCRVICACEAITFYIPWDGMRLENRQSTTL